ncbi:coagulation factor XIII B chain isoform X2 [Elgaria multicarinata webbii]|uniref:coagulation factor XIII B chain isoform X2 n=1 Tax=Elgaria multicarinata webbii TaxID=159646 RepID=UPI002FCD102E
MGCRSWIFPFILAATGELLTEDKLCDLPNIENGRIAPYYYSFRDYYFPMKKGKKLSYSCLAGFTTESGSQDARINCTTRGWAPAPKCYKKCARPPLDHGGFSDKKLSYKIRESLQYRCDSGYQTPEGSRNETIQCLQDGWSALAQCTDADATSMALDTCSAPDLLHGHYHTAQRVFKLNEKLQYECDDGYLTAGGHTREEVQCRRPDWSLIPKCTKRRNKCPPPPQPPNSKELSNVRTYHHGDILHLMCKPPFQIRGSDVIRCENGKWTSPPKCTVLSPVSDVGSVASTDVRHNLEPDRNCSSPPEVKNGLITSTVDRFLTSYKTDSSVRYRCNSFHLMKGPNAVHCVQGHWTEPPICLEPCLIDEENAGNHNIEMKWRLEEELLHFLHGDVIEFVCKPGYALPPSIRESQLLVQCTNGELRYPRCISKDPNDNCGSPPSIENGVLVGLLTTDYAHGSSVEYSCHEYHFLQGSRTVSCSKGQWTTPPICIEPCTLSQEEMIKNNLDLRWSFDQRPYFVHGEFVEFMCKPYYFKPRSSSPSDFRIQCQNGQLLYPHCNEIPG